MGCGSSHCVHTQEVGPGYKALSDISIIEPFKSALQADYQVFGYTNPQKPFSHSNHNHRAIFLTAVAYIFISMILFSLVFFCVIFAKSFSLVSVGVIEYHGLGD